MRLALATLLMTSIAVAGCSGSDGAKDQQAAPAPTAAAAAGTPAAPASAGTGEAPTAEEAAVLLASLPAPYNGGDLANGKKQFARCRSCHTLGEGQANLTGPNLYGVFGREAGSKAGYNYSEALRNADFTWDAGQLDAWLSNPRTFLPGNKMSFAGLKDEGDRVDLIAYLKTQTGYAPAG